MHDEKRPDRWLFTKDTSNVGTFNSYELSLCMDDGTDTQPLNGVEPPEDAPANSVFWTVYGSVDGRVQAIRGFNNIHDALKLLVSLGVITYGQQQYVEAAWMEESEDVPVDFETVSGVLREARDMIEVLTEHLVHCTATVGDIAKARKMVGRIDALDL